MITKQQLENAARAMGLFTAYFENDQTNVYVSVNKCGVYRVFNPLATTTQGKADLLDLMLALDIGHEINLPYMDAFCREDQWASSVLIINDNKHAALAEAAVSMANQIWESKQ